MSCPVTVGLVRFAEAMRERGHNPADAAREMGIDDGTVANILLRHRKVGMAIGAKIVAAYGGNLHDFTVLAPAGTRVPEVPRGKRKASASSPPEAA